MTLVQTLMMAGALGLGAAGLVVARRHWQRRASGGPAAALYLSAACFLVSALLWVRAFGLEVGLPVMLTAGSLMACLHVLRLAEVRPHRRPRMRRSAQPEGRPGRWWRGVLRFLLAGPVAFALAMAVALLIAMKAPMADQTRLVFAVALMPLLWACLMIGVLARTGRHGKERI